MVKCYCLCVQLVKIAAQKQAEAVEFVEALKAATKDVSADQPTAKPVVPASEMVPAASQESTKPVGAELFSGPQTKEKSTLVKSTTLW